MRASRFKVGCCTGAVIALSVGWWACLPHPAADFEDYQDRVSTLPQQTIEASTFEASTPVDAVEGLYYGACLAELAFGNTNKVFNFWTKTKYTPVAPGGKLELSIQVLELASPPGPPAKVASSGLVGAPFSGTSDVDANAKFSIPFGNVSIPGNANPITTGSDVLLEGASLTGRFGAERFCGRLAGHIAKPEAATRDLDPPRNICQFVPVKDGDATPTFTVADFQTASCPID